MILRLLISFLLLFIGVWVGAKFHQDPGHLLITFHHWTIETTLWVGIFLILTLFVLMHLLLLLIRRVAMLPKMIYQWAEQYRLSRARKKTEQGLIEFSEGHWSRAKQHLVQALPYTDSPLLNYLTAARAAQEIGDIAARDNYLLRAQELVPDAQVAVRLTQAELQLAGHEWDQAFVTLHDLQLLVPHHPQVLKLLMQLYHERGEWEKLQVLLPTLKYYQILPLEAADKLEEEAFFNALLAKINLNDSKGVDHLVDTLPKRLSVDCSLMAIYSQFLLDRKEDKKAEAVLRKCLQRHYDENLVELYGQLKLGKSPLSFAESLRKKHPTSSAVYLCLGRLNRQAALWGKAKHDFEESLRIAPTAEAYDELGQLLQQLGAMPEACQAYRNGLKLITQRSVANL